MHAYRLEWWVRLVVHLCQLTTFCLSLEDAETLDKNRTVPPSNTESLARKGNTSHAFEGYSSTDSPQANVSKTAPKKQVFPYVWDPSQTEEMPYLMEYCRFSCLKSQGTSEKKAKSSFTGPAGIAAGAKEKGVMYCPNFICFPCKCCFLGFALNPETNGVTKSRQEEIELDENRVEKKRQQQGRLRGEEGEELQGRADVGGREEDVGREVEELGEEVREVEELREVEEVGEGIPEVGREVEELGGEVEETGEGIEVEKLGGEVEEIGEGAGEVEELGGDVEESGKGAGEVDELGEVEEVGGDAEELGEVEELGKGKGRGRGECKERERETEIELTEGKGGSGSESLEGLDTRPESQDKCAMGNCCDHNKDPELVKTAGEYTGCLSQQSNKTYAIVRCPNYISDQDLRWACEYGTAEFTRDEPVTDPISRIVFRNRYCAQCHESQTYTPWRLQIACKHFQNVYAVTSTRELLLNLKDADIGQNPVCRLKYIPPPGTFPPECPPFYYPKDHRHPQASLIRTCNETGLWKNFDETLVTNCATYKGIMFSVREIQSPHRLFANLFCVICNGLQPEIETCFFERFINVNNDRLKAPFTMLLSLQGGEESEESGGVHECPPGQWHSLDNVCRNLTCAAGKTLNTRNSTCTTAVTLIRGLVYKLSIVLLPKQRLQTVSPLSAMLDYLHETFIEKVKGFVAQYSLTFKMRYIDSNPLTRDRNVTFDVLNINVSGNVTASFRTDRDVVEEHFVKKLLLEAWNSSVNGKPLVYSPELSHLENSTSLTQKFFKVSFSAELETNELALIPEFHIPHSEQILLTPALTCVFVEFNSSEYSFVEESSAAAGGSSHPKHPDNLSRTNSKTDEEFGSAVQNREVSKKIGLRLMRQELSFRELQSSWTLTEDERLLICVNKLEELSGGLARGAGPPSWQYLLSMMAIPLSVLCLVLLLLVHALLPALRTQPGMNTIGTCLTLLLAQLSLLFASHRLLSGAWCTALGVLVHLFWLSTFCWMSICSVHMFRAFSSTTEFRCSPGSFRVFMVNMAVTLMVPGLIVVLVMVVSWYKSGGKSIGYSSHSCYLQSAVMVGLSVILPLSVIVAFNLCLYVLTVYRIQKICRLQVCVTNSETEHGHQHARACLSLSLLTGATWIFSLLAESLDIHWLRGLSILANGGQGTLLLLSYVTTRRVAVMLAVRLGLKDDVITVTSRGHSNVSNSKTTVKRAESADSRSDSDTMY